MIKKRFICQLFTLIFLCSTILSLQSQTIDFPGDTLYICLQTEEIIEVEYNIGSQIVSYSWNVEPVDGIEENIIWSIESDTSISINILENGSFKVVFSILDSNGSTLKDSVIVIGLTECVLPGDADQDLSANHYDVLAVGLAFNSSGPLRPDAHTNFTPQGAIPWANTLDNGINFVHADADGNGIVEKIDISIIDLNYQPILVDTHGPEGSPLDPEIFLDIPTEAEAGSTIQGEIFLGTSDIPVNSLHGIAFSFDYDPAVLDETPVQIDFDDNWIGTLGEDVEVLVKDLRDLGRTDVAITRTNQIDIAGFGKLGDIVVTIDDITGKRADLFQLDWAISNVRAISRDGSFLPIHTLGVQTGKTLSNKPTLSHNIISAFPNPAVKEVFLTSEGALINEIRLIDLQGRNVLLINDISPTLSYQISVNKLNPGMYGIVVDTDKGRWVEKFWVYK